MQTYKNYYRLTLLIFVMALFGAGNDLKQAPSLKLGNGPDYWPQAFADDYRVLALNLKPAEKPFTTHYVIPGPKFKKEVYLWDTAFIAQVWKWRDASIAQEIFMPLFSMQKPNGMIPHASDQKYDSQPPLLSWSIWRIYEMTNDRAYLAKVYPNLKNFNQWWYSKRKMDNGLFFWDNRFESGLDNSPRFTNRSALKKRDLSKLAAIDLCSYMVVDDLSLARMAETLGKKDEALEFRKKADELKVLVNKYMWNEQDGLYYDFDFRSNQFLKINTNATFLPLFAWIPSQDQAKKLLGHIMDPGEYNTLIPLPTVALNDKNYFLDMWMGPTWINLDYMIILGMKDYGFGSESAVLAWKIVDALYKVWQHSGKFHEFYDPQSLSLENLHRKTGTTQAMSKSGDKPSEDFVGWTGLVDNLVIEIIFGLGRKNSQWNLSPALPPQASGMNFSLSIPSEQLQVSLDVKSSDQIKANVIQNNNKMNFDLGAGKSSNW
jgi:neutral trehalase